MDVGRVASLSSRTSANSSVGSRKSLSMEIAPELLRGVSLHECLSGWGKHWASPAGGMFHQTDDNTYRRSQRTTHFDNFLSHDWSTSRWLKLATLLVVFNSRAAAVATCLVSVLVGILRAVGWLPNEGWTVAIGHATFLIFFCFWQRIRSICWKPRIVFLDKMCIAQHDAALKEKGILGLAAFLDHSEMLTMLWSPRTFQRLWCVYEICTFLRGKGQKPVEVMPVKLALLLCANSANWFILAAGYHAIAGSPGQQSSTERTFWVGGLCVCLAGTMVPWTYYLGIGIMEDLSLMPQQLQSFRIQDTVSACCSHGHVHPELKEAIPCDRQLVFSTLKEWFGRADVRKEKHLDYFNALVREHLAPSVLKSVGGDNLPVGYTLYMTASCNMPFIANFIPILAHGPPEDFSSGDAAVWAVRILMNWAFTSMLAVFTTRLNLFICRYASLRTRCSTWRSKLCLAVVLAQAAVLFVTVLWGAYRIPTNRVDAKSWVPILPFLLMLGLTVILFLQGRVCIRRIDDDSTISREVEREGEQCWTSSLEPPDDMVPRDDGGVAKATPDRDLETACDVAHVLQSDCAEANRNEYRSRPSIIPI